MGNWVAGILATIISGVAVGGTLDVNQQLQCVSESECGDRNPNSSSNIAVQITVVSFTWDSALRQTKMRLRLKSQHNESRCRFEGFNFQDEAGKEYPPAGALEGGGSFSLVKGKERNLTALYSFLPSSGSTYTLLGPKIHCDDNYFTPTYGDLEVTF